MDPARAVSVPPPRSPKSCSATSPRTPPTIVNSARETAGVPVRSTHSARASDADRVVENSVDSPRRRGWSITERPRSAAAVASSSPRVREATAASRPARIHPLTRSSPIGTAS